MRKNVDWTRQVTDDNLMWCMHFACWITKATDKQSEYETLITFPRKHSLRESASMLLIKVKFSRSRPGVAQRVGRGIALLFHDRGPRSGWVVSSTPRPHFTPGKDPVPIVQEGGWAPGPVWTGRISRPHRESIPDRPARSQSLYRLSYLPPHTQIYIYIYIYIYLTCPCTHRQVSEWHTKKIHVWL